MTLAATETLDGGRVHDAQNRTSVTAGTGALPAGAYWSGGFVRDADGRLLVLVETLGAAQSAGCYFSGGFLRGPLGRLVVAQASGALSASESLSGGEVRDTAGRLVLASGTLGAAVGATDRTSAGLRDAAGRRYAAGLSVAAAYRAAVLADSPVSYWRLGESVGTTAADVQGVNPGTYVNTPTLGVAGAASDGDTAVTFARASSQRITVPHSASLAITGALTLEAWVNLADITNYQLIFSKGLTNVASPYELRIDQTTGKPTFTVVSSAVTGTNAVGTGAWHHVAVTFGPTTVTHYLDGVANGTGSLTAGTDNAQPLLIGTRADALSFFNGSLDEVAIYNTALSGARIAAHFAAR